jgi:hypothetical protein
MGESFAREGYEVYEAYVEGHEAEIEQGREFVLQVTDLTDFRQMVVRARVAKVPGDLPGSQPLWLRTYDEEMPEEPWGIQILEELDEDEVRPVRADVARGETPVREQIYGGG